MKCLILSLVITCCLVSSIQSNPTRVLSNGGHPTPFEEESGSGSGYEYEYDWEDWLDEINALTETKEMYEDPAPAPTSWLTPVVTSVPLSDLIKGRPDKSDNNNDLNTDGDYSLNIRKSSEAKKEHELMKEMVQLLKQNVKKCPDNFFLHKDNCYRISKFKATQQTAARLCYSYGARLTTVPEKTFLLRLVWELEGHPGFKEESELTFWTSAELRDDTWYWASTNEVINLGKQNHRQRRQVVPVAISARNNRAIFLSKAATNTKVLMEVRQFANKYIDQYFICEMPACSGTEGEDAKGKEKPHSPPYPSGERNINQMPGAHSHADIPRPGGDETHHEEFNDHHKENINQMPGAHSHADIQRPGRGETHHEEFNDHHKENTTADPSDNKDGSHLPENDESKEAPETESSKKDHDHSHRGQQHRGCHR